MAAETMPGAPDVHDSRCILVDNSASERTGARLGDELVQRRCSICPTLQAFTLIEILVVVSIVAVLVMFMLPAIQIVKRSAQSIQCLANLRQIGCAMTGYMGDFQGMLPPVNIPGITEWLTVVSPYAEADRWSGENPGWAQFESRSVLHGCPRVPRIAGVAHGPNQGYAMNVFLGGGWGSARYAGITLRSSRYLVGERTGDNVLNGLNVIDFIRHKPNTNALMCDMHVQPLTYRQANFALNDPSKL